MSLPVVTLTGSPFAQGLQHGELLRERVADNIAIYFDRFARETLLPREEVLAIAAQYAQKIEQQSPAYAEGMRGVAQGSGFDYLDVVALNVRYEILYYQFGKMAMAREAQADGCTLFALLPEANTEGHLLIGQNWDWIPEVRGAVLHTIEEDGLQTMAFTEAGIVGAKVGFNSEGIGLAINGITTTADDWSRFSKPAHVRFYEVLRCREFNAAVNVVVDEKRACSTNFLIAQPPGWVLDIEAAPDVEGLLTPVEGVLTHANHFVAPADLGITEPPNPRRIYSRRREARLRELLLAAKPAGIDAIKTALRDTQDEPFGLCRHRNPEEPPELHYVTVTSAIMDLDARVMHLTDGPPDQGDYQTVAL